MPKTAEYALDTNVVLRYLLQDDHVLSGKANDIFVAVNNGELTVYLDPVVLAEIVWVLKSFYKFSPEEVYEWVLPIASHNHIILPDRIRYTDALRIYLKTQDFGDACACALALEACDGNLLSFDKGIKRVPGISRKEEFKESNPRNGINEG